MTCGVSSRSTLLLRTQRFAIDIIHHWMELASALAVDLAMLETLMKEGEEIVRIMVASKKTARSNA